MLRDAKAHKVSQFPLTHIAKIFLYYIHDSSPKFKCRISNTSDSVRGSSTLCLNFARDRRLSRKFK